MALDQFLDAESRDTRHGERINVQIDPDTIKVMTRPAAEAALRRLDLALRPWGKPGVGPTEVGCWYLQSRDDPKSPWGQEQPVVTTGSLPGSLARSPVSVYGIGWSWSALAVDDTQGSVCNRFRRRWTPEGPVTT